MKWLPLTIAVVVGWLCVVGTDSMRILDGSPEVDTQKPELWAVLVAGSSGWYNYRHQADVCHAYQILRQHGVPEDHIIVMMFDDIAYNPENPTPGVIINRPDGPNVYEGIHIDYSGEDVTPENFLNILKGNSSAMAGIGSGKVVKSNQRDRIFINLVDHGAPGVFAFPDGYLHAKTLANAVLQLHSDRKFKEMVIYVEACESGSMFKHLIPSDSGVYAMTASNPHEPSYACYMDEKLGTYLGDVFSIKWTEDTDKENIHHETLKRQFHIVHKEVTTSTVMQWGEHDINKQKLWMFMGEKDDQTVNSIHYYDEMNVSIPELNGAYYGYGGDEDDMGNDGDDPCISSAVASPDVPIAILESRVKNAKDEEETAHWKKELTTLHLNRLLVQVVMRTLVNKVTQNDDVATRIIMGDAHNITKWDCYERSVNTFNDMCFNLARNPYALRVMQMAVNLCEHGYTAERFLEAAESVCIYSEFIGIN